MLVGLSDFVDQLLLPRFFEVEGVLLEELEPVLGVLEEQGGEHLLQVVVEGLGRGAFDLLELLFNHQLQL